MSLIYSLNGEWELRDCSLALDARGYGQVMADEDGWMSSAVPGDVHTDLINANRIKEPLIGLNSFECEWIEERSWWYRKAFSTLSEWLECDIVELELSGLDSMAEIFLNEVHIGTHISAFRPFIRNVKELLRKDGRPNLLVVRVTSGLEHFSAADVAEVAPYIGGDKGGPGQRGDWRRVFVRKPQYSWGWDWSPRVPTCGITGGALIRPIKTLFIRDINTRTSLLPESAKLHLTVNVENADPVRTGEAEITICITDPDGACIRLKREAFLRSGRNPLSFTVDIENPRLWWLNGMGEQPLYKISASASASGVTVEYPPFDCGLRTVELDRTAVAEGQRLFAIKVNGVRVYCRGGNWIPADAVYARVSDEKYETLIREAKEANFNMLRVWGGGLYERDCFYRYCDRMGILIWQDFMFACAAYPDHLDWFANEVRKEAGYQVERLRNHPCIALWCGNNENTQAFAEWWSMATTAGAYLYNHVIPEVVEAKSPDIPYWNSSPYGGSLPNSGDCGDRHHWGECMMNPEMEARITPEEYDKIDPKFISEYGYVGPCSIETTREYLGSHPLDRNGKAWLHHNNAFEKDTVAAGIRKHYRDPESLTVEEYLLYAGLCQGMMYEYSLDSFRRCLNNSGGLFWMYNDCWGEVGWTIVDYYCRRKISYNFVRRANAPKRLILRKKDSVVTVTLCNDTSEPVAGILEYGYISFDGTSADLQRTPFEAEPFSRKIVKTFESDQWDFKTGAAIARISSGCGIIPGILHWSEFRDLTLSAAPLTIIKVASGTYTISAEKFAHAVHFNLPPGAKASDEYFDLLPGEERIVNIEGVDDRFILEAKSVI